MVAVPNKYRKTYVAAGSSALEQEYSLTFFGKYRKDIHRHYGVERTTLKTHLSKNI